MLHILQSTEGTVVAVHIIKARSGRGSTAPCILNVGIGWRRVVILRQVNVSCHWQASNLGSASLWASHYTD